MSDSSTPISTTSAPVKPAQGLALTALSLALVSVLVSIGYAGYQRQKVRTLTLTNLEQVEALRTQIVELTTHNSAALNALSASQQQLQQQQADLQALIVGGAAQFADAQRLHAAEYLVREAEQVLMLSQDISSARRMLATAALELDNGSKNAAMQRLLKAVRTDSKRLSEYAGVDALAVARTVAVALSKVDALRDLQAQFDGAVMSNDKRTNNENGNANRYASYSADDSQWWGRFANNLRDLSGDWFIVRHYGNEVEAPLSALEKREIKQALKLALASAQAAALRHEQGLYYSAINQAASIVNTHFANSTEGISLATDLQALSQRLVSVTATLSLQASALLDDAKLSAQGEQL